MCFLCFSWFSHQSIGLWKWKSSLKISQTMQFPALSSKPYCRIKSSACCSTLPCAFLPSCHPSQEPVGGGGWPMGTPRLASTARMRDRSTAEGLRGLPLKSFSMICCWTFFWGVAKKNFWRQGSYFKPHREIMFFVSQCFEKKGQESWGDP